MSPRHTHLLRGCATRPLSAYLKALGVLRAVAEQKDPEARGWWTDEGFRLLTTLDLPVLLRFFLREWAPSPMVSPWNKGSGLLGEDPKGVGPVARSTAPRLQPLREGIAAARALTEEMQRAVADEKAIKEEKTRIKDRAAKERLAVDPRYKSRLAEAARRCKRLKDELQPECQRRWRGGVLRWLRAAVVLDADGGATFPALLGTGGNDGKLDFTNNALQRLGDLFALDQPDGAPKPGAEAALRAALLGEAAPALVPGAIGQYAPRVSGGPNASSGPLGDSALNPWDLPLLLEGALLFTAGTSRRLGAEGVERTVAPFSVRGLGAGYGSAAGADEGARGEQWMPVWDRPWSLRELSALLVEGRSQIGLQRAESALDMARALARLGVARGVASFERYGYIERNGKSNYAVPLGRWAVRADPRGALLDDLEAGQWWGRLRRAARDDRAPASLTRLERRLTEAAMAALSGGDQGSPARWQGVLLASSALEGQLTTSAAFTVSQRLRPLPPLGPGWLRAADDGSPELRLALALAGAGAARGPDGRPFDAIRHHWMPLDTRGGFRTAEGGLQRDPRVVMTGRAPLADLCGLVERRLIEAERDSRRILPIQAGPGRGASIADLMALIDGRVDLARTLDLARALAALDWGRLRPEDLPAPPTLHLEVDPSWAVFRLCALPRRLPSGLLIPVDPAIQRLLAAGEGARAYALARARLIACGLYPPHRLALLDPGRARLIAASLAFPISLNRAQALVHTLDPGGPTASKESLHVR